jgi:trimethylamine:corrinoid methyltransferase-like protein
MLQIHLPDDAGMEALGEGVFEVLERVGAMFQNVEILRALESAGAKVNHSSQVAKFPKLMLREFIGAVRAENARVPQGRTDPPFRGPSLPTFGTQVAQFVYDFDRQDRRPGTAADLVDFVKLGSALRRDAGVGHCVLLTDVPPMVEPLEAALVLAEYAPDPGTVFAWNVAQEPYLSEMAQIMGIDQWHSWGAVCIAHPLRFDRTVADRFVRMMRSGYGAGLTAMPVVGLSTPVTVEGFIAVASAELLAAWVAGRALNPRVGLGGSMWAGTPDMKTGHVSFSAFDALFYDFAAVQFLEKWCGVRVSVGGGEYSAAKAPGLYAALEKAYKALAIAAFTGEHPGIGEGMLDSGKVLSEVQFLLERELTVGVQQFEREVTPTVETMAMSTIMDVGVGARSNYLQSEHTALNFRQSLWLPQIWDRTGWNGFESEAQLLRRMQEKAKALAADYQKPEGREQKLSALRKVVEKARAELL